MKIADISEQQILVQNKAHNSSLDFDKHVMKPLGFFTTFLQSDNFRFGEFLYDCTYYKINQCHNLGPSIRQIDFWRLLAQN